METVQQLSCGNGLYGFMAKLRVMLWLFCLLAVPAGLFCDEINLTQEEKLWLDKHRESLILAPTPSYPPIDFFDEDGNHSGVSGDISRIIEEQLNIRFQRKQLPSWDAILVEARADRIDLTTIAHRTPNREKFWLFTEPYINAPTVILSRKELTKELSLNTMNDLKVGMVRGYAIDEFLAQNHPSLRIIPVKDDQTGLEQLSLGELDALIADLPTAGYIISKRRIGNLRVAGQTRYSYNYSIAVSKKHPLLRSILDKALANISAETHKKIANKWFEISMKPFYLELQFWLVSGIFLLFFAAIIFTVIALNRSLKSLVEKRTEELSTAHEQLRRILDAATQVAVIATDQEGRIDLFNSGAERILGYSADEATGKMNVVSFHLEQELESRADVLQACFGRQISLFEALVARPGLECEYEEREWTYVTKNGESIPVNLGVSAIKDKNNSIVGYLAVAADISARKKAEDALRNSEAQLLQSEKLNAIGQLAGGIAHDFNNQLTGVMGFAEILVNRLDEPELKEFASQILTSADRAAALTRQLLAFSRKGKYLNTPIDVHAAIEEVIEILERSIDKQIVIKRNLCAEKFVITGDPAQVQNAILNLALNARDALTDGGEITFCTKFRRFLEDLPEEELVKGCYLQLSVSDNGAGMDEDTQRRLFEPFFTTKSDDKGTGLGLASVYGTIKNHGGTIRVYSEQDQGSTFKLFFPVVDEDLVLVKEQNKVIASRGNNERILIVDDEPVMLAVAEEILRNLGYDPVTCGDPEEALNIYRKEWNNFDLVILDMIMPKKGGRDLFQELKLINQDLKAILISGFSLNGEAQRILDLGVIAFVQKPFSEVEIATTVQKALS